MSGDILSIESGAHDLRRIIAAAIACEPLGARELDRILRRYPKQGRGFYSKREILAAFRASLAEWPVAEVAFAEKLRTCPTRTLSGVAPVALLTKPFPCPGRCVFCPSDVRMPKSYLANEPGCQRAQANRFDPYLQTWNRLAAFHAMGHSTAKVELIVLGGTWSFYPESYQVWFVTRSFEALYDFGAGIDSRATGPMADPCTKRAASANAAGARSTAKSCGRAKASAPFASDEGRRFTCPRNSNTNGVAG